MPRKSTSKDIVTDLPGIAAISRAMSILCAFKSDDLKLSLSEIARRTSMYKSTASRVIDTLERYDILSRDKNGDFRLGVELIRLGALARRSSGDFAEINAILQQLVDETGESATYYVRRGESRLALYRVDSSKSVRDHIQAGDLLPLHLGAAGRVLSIGDKLANDSDPFRTIASLGERDSELAAVAGPVYAKGTIIAALSVSGPITRFTPDAIATMSRAIKEKCRTLSSLLSAD